MENDLFLAAPRKRSILMESRAVADFLSMAGELIRPSSEAVCAHARRVMVVPGFGGSDGYTRFLRTHLNRLGYLSEGWGLGNNSGGEGLRGDVDFFEVPEKYRNSREIAVPLLSMRLRERLRQRVDETGEPFTLIGHSLGGYLAREVTRQAPDLVTQLITVGAPVYGGPKYTAAAGIYQARGVNMDWIESVIIEREKILITRPITTVVSRTDGVVGYEAAIDRNQPHAKLVEVNASHAGMLFNRRIWAILVHALQ